MDLVIKNGMIVMATDTFKGDIAIRGGKIAALTQGVHLEAREEIDAEGMLVLPGVIDGHTHFSDPAGGLLTSDDFLSGSRACAAGGVTTFIDCAVQEKGQSPLEALKMRRSEAQTHAYVDYALHMAFTDFSEGTLKDIPKLIEAGVPTFKLFMGLGKAAWMADDGALITMLEQARDQGALIGIHAENHHLVERNRALLLREGKREPRWHSVSSPHYVEVEALRRALYLTEVTNSRLFVFHLTTAEGTRLVGEAKGKGMMVFAETCPQYLLLSDEKHEGPEGLHFVASPPLRKAIDNEILWRGISVGAIQVVSSDHSPFTRAQKSSAGSDFTSVPPGLPGVETLLSLLYSEGVKKGRITASQMVEIVSANPAKLFGLYPSKGSLAPGADADVVIFDPAAQKTLRAADLHMNTDFSPYEGMEVIGVPLTTLSRGEIIFKDGAFPASPGRGMFQERHYREQEWEARSFAHGGERSR
ncbi:MAG: dihydropyrimidinase [Candidatus Eremiobacteraeota bacterium]|nr:dihydropyrimidinase [Candidatus Eremiobacteraeota bacterium]